MSDPAQTPRSVQRSLGSIALGLELVVVFLAALVIFGLHALPAAVALAGGGCLVLAMIATIALLRYRFAYLIGWILQAVVIAAGFLVTEMFIVGAIFAALWAYCTIVGAKIDRREQPRGVAPDAYSREEDSTREEGDRP